MLTKQSASLSFMTIVLIAAAGAAVALYLTRFGPGAGGDSTSYLMGAENLLQGNGFSRYSGGYEIRPITGFPPGYSVALAAAGALGLPLVEAGRWLNALIFAVNIALIGGMVYWLTRSSIASILAGLLFLARPTQLELHAWVMSEPLFILLSLIGICLIGLYLGRQQIGWLIGAAVVAALATLTRYVGAALIGTGVLGVLAFGPRPVTRRIRDALAFTALSLGPVYLWLLRNREVGGTLVNRELSYHAMDPDLIRLFLADFSSWFVPHQVPLPTAFRAVLALLIAGGALVAAGMVLTRAWARWDHSRLELVGPSTELAAVPWLLTIYAVGSLAIVWANSTLLDAATTATAPPRYLAPVFVSTLVLLCILVPHVAKLRLPTAGGRGSLVAYAVVLLGFYAANSLGMIRDPLPHLGYTGRRYLSPEVVAYLDRIPEEAPIVSNNPELVYVLIGRPAYVRPITFDPYRGELREDYDSQFAQFEDNMSEGGFFVVFDELELDDQQVIERLELQLLEEYPAVRIFGPSEASASQEPTSPSKVVIA